METLNQPFFFPSSELFKRTTTCILSFSVFLFSFLLLCTTKEPLTYLSLVSNTTPTAKHAGANCDFTYGRWVRDESFTGWRYSEDCRFLDPGFRCLQNGRKDIDYVKWRWQPHGCDLPRFNASEMLERSRNSRIVFVGDSLGRNQWESLLCMLAKNIKNKSEIYEENGNPITKHRGYLSMIFSKYNLSVEYYRSPFLVATGRPPPNSRKNVQRAIQVDRLDSMSSKWLSANVLIFNAGHWWNDDKTSKMGWYFQEGRAVNMSMDVMEAFKRFMNTWKLWVMRNPELEKTHVFFRSYSPAHFGGGAWDRNGTCEANKEPERNRSALAEEPWTNKIISRVINEMKGTKMKVQFLNITHLTEFRKDGHPSAHREPGTPLPIIEDCSHWCLPGVPDTWNEMLYAYLFSMHFQPRSNLATTNMLTRV